MKIHKVIIENLNSLYGRHEIDLDRDLDKAPLFLIVGPTGAGKSTIMDAISLALFGKTPRLSGGHGQEDTDSRMIMSRGTGRCVAEVVFSKQQPGAPRTFYRARWEAWRSRDNPSGAFQKPRRSLVQEDDMGFPARVLANDTKKKIWGPAFVEVLEGMEPAEFQRSMLLAQGQFAAFLRATVAERAQILERLTSTERYREIGARAMERYRAAKSHVDALRAGVGAIDLLDAAQLEELARSVELAGAEAVACENRFRRARKLLDWSKRDGLLKNDLADATERLTKERKRWEGQTANRDRLAESNRCADAGEILRRLKANQRERLQTNSAIDDSLEALEALDARHAAAAEVAARAAESFVKANDALDAAAPLLVQATAASAAIRQLEAALKTLSESEKALKAVSVRQAGAKEEQRKLQADSAARAEQEARLQAQVISTAEALETLLDGESADAAANRLQTERSAEQERAQALTMLLEKFERFATSEARSASLEESLVALNAQSAEIQSTENEARLRESAAAEQLSTLRDLKAAQAVIAELDDRRRELKEGEECPLCGSKEHPFAGHENHSTAKDALRTTEEKIVRVTAELATARATLEDAAKASSAHAARLEARAAEASQAADAAEVARSAAEAMFEAAGATTPEEAAAGLSRTSQRVQTLEAQAAAISGANREHNAAREALAAFVAASLATKEQGVAIAARIAELAETSAERARALEAAGSGVETARDSALEAVRELGTSPEPDSSVDELLAALRTPFDGKAPEEFRASLEAERAKAEVAQRTASVSLADIDKERAAAKATLAGHRAAAEKLDAKSAVDQAALSDQLVALGIEDARTLEAKVLAPAERELLQRNVDDVRSRFEQAKGRADALAQQLSLHREVQPDGLDPTASFGALELEDQEAAAALEASRQEVARLAARLEEQERARGRRGELIAELDAAEKDAALWNEMRSLIGSNEGGAFQRFAQTMNLAELVDRANTRLKELEPRYELVVATDADGRPELAFAVRDHEHGGRIRPQTTLSGGETFLVSLALALALSEYRQTQMPIETLLLDEGFGTLDAETLDVAMSALERLCATGGTQIGVISHVEGLKERINAQILVEKLGAGRSRLRPFA